MKFSDFFFLGHEILGIKNNLQLSRGEICVANIITPANGASLGSPLRAK